MLLEHANILIPKILIQQTRKFNTYRNDKKYENHFKRNIESKVKRKGNFSIKRLKRLSTLATFGFNQELN